MLTKLRFKIISKNTFPSVDDEAVSDDGEQFYDKVSLADRLESDRMPYYYVKDNIGYKKIYSLNQRNIYGTVEAVEVLLPEDFTKALVIANAVKEKR